jgi:hypothetical protein
MGKTTETAKFAPNGKDTRRLFVDMEAGLKVVQKMGIDSDVAQIHSYTDLIRLVQMLQEDKTYDVVIMDTLNEMARIIIQGALALPANRVFREVPILQDYSLTVERARTTIRDLRKLIHKGKWIFFTCSEGIDKDENSGKLVGGPALVGKQLAPEICYLMDEVYRMTAANTQSGPHRILVTQPDSIWFAKTRESAPAQIVCQKDNPATLEFLYKK